MAKRYDPILCMMVEEEETIKATDSIGPRSREVVSEVNNYLRELGKNNSVGHYDKVVFGVRYLLSHTLLQGEELKKAVRQETNRLLKKYNLDQDTAKDEKAEDPFCAIDKALATCDAASGDAMKQIADTAKSWARQYNQLFEKATSVQEVEKIRSNQENDYRRAMDNLDKIYNEVSQAYGMARNEVIRLFKEVGSNSIKAYKRVSGTK